MRSLRYGTQKSRQHPDFPGGHPPEYYPSLRLLNFAKRTGYGALSLRWPSTNATRNQCDHMPSNKQYNPTHRKHTSAPPTQHTHIHHLIGFYCQTSTSTSTPWYLTRLQGGFYSHTHTHAHIYARTHTYTYTHTYKHIHTHTHTYTHIQTHIHTHARQSSWQHQ